MSKVVKIDSIHRVDPPVLYFRVGWAAKIF